LNRIFSGCARNVLDLSHARSSLNRCVMRRPGTYGADPDAAIVIGQFFSLRIFTPHLVDLQLM
jgi:hypothetical protein